MYRFDNNAHSVFSLYYHLVMVTKYRRKVFDSNISDRAKNIFEYICPKYNITRVILYFGQMYSNMFLALSEIFESNTFLRYLVTITRW